MLRIFDPDVLYLVASRALVPGGDYLDRLAAALEGGVGLLQMREKGSDRSRLLDLGRSLRDLCRRHDAGFIVNDDPELALALDADGVHLGQSDLPCAAARRIVGPRCWIGLSTHDWDQIDRARAAGADHLGLGPIFKTDTKDAGPPIGLEILRRLRTVHPELPVFPIGGIDIGNIGLVRAAGARGAAVSSAVLRAEDPKEAARRMIEILRAPNIQSP